MIQVGIFTGVFPHPLEERAKRIRGLGLNTVAVDEVKNLPAEKITPQLCKEIRDTYCNYNLPISVISGYVNELIYKLHTEYPKEERSGIARIEKQQ